MNKKISYGSLEELDRGRVDWLVIRRCDMSLKEKIEQAKNLVQMNALRMEVVKAKDASILKLWQDKFWRMKKCPTCEHSL